MKYLLILLLTMSFTASADYIQQKHTHTIVCDPETEQPVTGTAKELSEHPALADTSHFEIVKQLPEGYSKLFYVKPEN